MLVGLTALSVEIKHKLIHPVGSGLPRHIQGAEHVVFHSLLGIFLHHRHMLMGRGVKDDLRRVLVKDLLQAIFVPNRSQHHLKQLVVVLLEQLVFNVKQTVFMKVQDNQLFRSKPKHLPADFRTDGTRPASYQNHLSRDKRFDSVHI